MVRQAYTLREADDDFGQAGILVREVWDDEIRANFVKTVAGHLLGGVAGDVLERAFEYWKSVDADTGKKIEELVREGIDAGARGAQPGEAKEDASSPSSRTRRTRAAEKANVNRGYGRSSSLLTAETVHDPGEVVGLGHGRIQAMTEPDGVVATDVLGAPYAAETLVLRP